MAWFPIARALIEMSYADLPASMGKPCIDFDTPYREHSTSFRRTEAADSHDVVEVAPVRPIKPSSGSRSSVVV
jgi:hypothetical protein